MTVPLLIQTGVFDPTLAGRLEGANRSPLARRRNAGTASRRRLASLISRLHPHFDPKGSNQ